MSPTTSRGGQRTPERPPKRKASSSPEEGEVEDGETPDPSSAGVGPASGKFRVPFPFKNKNDPGPSDSRRRDYDRDRDRYSSWRRSDPERSYYRSSDRDHYERDRDSRHQSHRQAVDYPKGDALPRDGVSIERKPLGDHYEPSSSRGHAYSHLRNDILDKERPRDYTRADPYSDRGKSKKDMYGMDSYRPRSPARLVSPKSYSRSPSPSRRRARPVHSRSRSRSQSRSRSSSRETGRERSKSKQNKHRLPTPRSYMEIVRDQEDRFDSRHEPYNRERYRDRQNDPRGQYQRDMDDDSSRFSRTSESFGRNLGRSRFRMGQSPGPSTPPRPSYSPRGRAALTPPRSQGLTPPRRRHGDAGSPPGKQQRPMSPPPPTLVPPPPPPAAEGVQDALSAPDELRAHAAVSFALKRPGAPRNDYSPPPMLHNFSSKATSPVPPPVSKMEDLSTATQPKKAIVEKKKRSVVRRTREEEKQLYGRVFQGCGQRDDYEIMTKLGEGTFGYVAHSLAFHFALSMDSILTESTREVHKALHKNTQATVALKRILMHNEKEGMPVTSLREIKILKALNHPCIINLVDMFVVPSKSVLILPSSPCDACDNRC